MDRNSTTTKIDVYQIITNRIIALLEEGTIPWKKPWSYGASQRPSNLVSQRHYQGINCFLLACTPYASPYWLTYSQASKIGGHVRKGERGNYIVFWKGSSGFSVGNPCQELAG